MQPATSKRRAAVGITEFVASIATQVIQSLGYAGIFILMIMESMVLPVPSEAVMPFAGFLVADGVLSPVLVACAATLGSIVGSLASYAIGLYGGRPFLNRFGKYLLLNREDLERTDRFFRRRGSPTILIGRFIPIVRHLISIPAGLAKMPLLPFAIFTVVGAGIWNSFLTWCGYVLRKNWERVMAYSRYIDLAVIALGLALIALFIWRHLVRRKSEKTEE
jgi:membrane protein DedA with SNARE-associated domain